MLVKVLSHALASGADYEKTLKIRRNLSVLGMILGLAVLMIVNMWKPASGPVCDPLKSLGIAMNRGCHWSELDADL